MTEQLPENISALYPDTSVGDTAHQHHHDVIHQRVNALSQGSLVFNVKDYGAVGDGSTNDTTAVQGAINAANAFGGVVHFPFGVYSVSDLVSYGGITLQGVSSSASILKQRTSSSYCVSVNPGSGGSSDPLTNETGIVLKDLTLLGTVATDGFSEHKHLLNLNAVTDVRIDRVNFIGWRGDGIYLGSSNAGGLERHNRNVWISDCVFDGVNNDNRNGISIVDGDNVWIKNNLFKNCSRSDMPGGIDIEPNPGDIYSVTRNIYILNNTFKDVLGIACVLAILTTSQSSLTTPAQNFSFEGNIFSSPLADGFAVTQPGNASSSTIPINLSICNNVSTGGQRPYQLGGISGVRISGNRWYGDVVEVAIGFSTNVHDVFVSGDTHRNGATTSTRVYSIGFGTNLRFDANTYDNCGASGGGNGTVVHLADAGSTANVDFVNNHVFGTNTTVVADVGVGHTTTTTMNRGGFNKTSLTLPITVFNANISIDMKMGTLNTGVIWAAGEIRPNGAAGTNRTIAFMTSGNYRWLIQANASAESGSNTGSNLEIVSRDDAGAQLKVVVSINRANGSIALADGITLNLGSTIGSVFAGASTQKLSFWGKTPIVQPSAPPAAATDLATALTLVNDLRSKLISVGIVA